MTKIPVSKIFTPFNKEILFLVPNSKFSLAVIHI